MRHWSLILGIAILVALAGCGQGTSAPAAQAPSQGQAPAASAPGAAAQPSAPPPRVSLLVGLNAVSASIAPLWLALDAGIFAQHGFDVEFITLQSSSQVAKVMASGEIPIALSAAAGVVDAALAGDDQVLVSGIQNYMNFWVYGRPEIASVADLRGKRIGATRIGSGAHLGLVEMLKRHGLEPDRDAAIMQIGGMPEVGGALTAGAVDAGILSIPWNFRAQDEGMRLIYDVSAQQIPYLQNGLATSRHYIAQHEDVVRRFMAAHVEGLARVHKDKATTVDVLARNLKSDDRGLMERTYDLIEPLFERVPYPTAASIQTVIDQRAEELPAARNLTPSQLTEERFVRELEQNGFVNRVYNQ
jgi:ABC-type nitrate/sulfonate/bicarbonate transport system substrate-binding protein